MMGGVLKMKLVVVKEFIINIGNDSSLYVKILVDYDKNQFDNMFHCLRVIKEHKAILTNIL